MIGVIARTSERAAVEEFFELFKTPWEFYRLGRQYDIIIAAGVDVPEVQTKLLLIYSSRTEATDKRFGVVGGPCVRQISMDYRGTALPLYGDALTFDDASRGVACVKADSATVGLEIRLPEVTVLRFGYDLFHEVQLLLSGAQPVEYAHVPTLDCHIEMLRSWILTAGINLLEIPPSPAGYSFIVCLTHDIDFIGIRQHKFDHSMWGFVYRSTVGATLNFLTRRISFTRLLQIWRAVISLPLVYLGWANDFWSPFEWYLRLENRLPATYFLIPFKGRPGKNVRTKDASKRATAYDITDISEWTTTLSKQGCEISVHGIDSWHDVEAGREELARIAKVTRKSEIGIRMHWLLHDRNTFRVLEQAGYAYDSTLGYNETIGYRNATTQAFRPDGAQTLLELPLHIQDGALFYPQRLNLSEPEAWKRCAELIHNAQKVGGVLTILWHDRSHGPERFWGDFYAKLLGELRTLDGWFGTAAEAVGWFQKRRQVRFEQTELEDGSSQLQLLYDGEEILPPLKIRVYSRTGSERNVVDFCWKSQVSSEKDPLLQQSLRFFAKFSEPQVQDGTRQTKRQPASAAK
jgi:hypothetical protein